MENEGAADAARDAEAAAAALALATADGAEATGAIGTTMFKENDVVMGVAHKHKEKFNEQECKILAVLIKHYAVVMTTGPAAGAKHKYYHDQVRAIAGTPPDTVGNADQPSTGGEPEGGDSGMREISDLFG